MRSGAMFHLSDNEEVQYEEEMMKWKRLNSGKWVEDCTDGEDEDDDDSGEKGDGAACEPLMVKKGMIRNDEAKV